MIRTSDDEGRAYNVPHNKNTADAGSCHASLLALSSARWSASSAPAQAPTAAPASGPIPLEHFTKFDEFGGLKISPDGEFIAMLTGKYGRSVVAFVDLKTKKTRQRHSHARGLRDRRVPLDLADAADLHDRAAPARGSVRPTPTGEIFGINRDGSASAAALWLSRGSKHDRYAHARSARPATPAPELLSALKNDPDHILIAEYPWTHDQQCSGLYNPDAKPLICAARRVQRRRRSSSTWRRSAARSLLLDHDDNVRFALGRNERPGSRSQLEAAARQRVDRLRARRFPRRERRAASLQRDNRSVYLTGVREGESLSMRCIAWICRRSSSRRCTRSMRTTSTASSLISPIASSIGVSGYARAADRFLAAQRQPCRADLPGVCNAPSRRPPCQRDQHER